MDKNEQREKLRSLAEKCREHLERLPLQKLEFRLYSLVYTAFFSGLFMGFIGLFVGLHFWALAAILVYLTIMWAAKEFVWTEVKELYSDSQQLVSFIVSLLSMYVVTGFITNLLKSMRTGKKAKKKAKKKGREK